MGTDAIDLNNINRHDDSFDDNDLEIKIHVKLIAWCNKYRQCKAFKKELSKELMIVAWHPTRW